MADPKLLILDCDGTLRVPGTESTLMPGVRERIAALPAGTAFAVASNQEGVAKGQVTAKVALDHIQTTLNKALSGGSDADWPIAMCPHQASDRCICRKPLPFMLVLDVHRVINMGFNLGFKDVLYVGNENRDKECAARAGVAFQWAKDFFK